MARKKTKETEKKPNSIFRKLEITSISQIFEIYLQFTITQAIVDNIAIECANFLFHKMKQDQNLILKQFNFTFNFKEPDYILVNGSNLLSSLWIIGVFPENPENLINKTTYVDSDFTYKFYTKNKNLIVTKTKTHARKPKGDQRNRKLSKGSQ